MAKRDQLNKKKQINTVAMF